MNNLVPSTLSENTPSARQVDAWMRGLLTIAWADGDFNAEEQHLIADLTQHELADANILSALDPISPAELASVFGQDTQVAENFLRTAVMVAIADGTYSPPEDEILQQFCQALGQQQDILASLQLTLYDPEVAPAPEMDVSPAPLATAQAGITPLPQPKLPLRPVQEWLDQLDIQSPRVAHFLCKMIPSQCPFERDIALFGQKIVHIPPLCKLNPLYEQMVGLRFRALSYLADDCGVDVTPYC